MIHTIHVPANCKKICIEIGHTPVNSAEVEEIPEIPAYVKDGTVKELLNMLSECDKAQTGDERCEIAEKIFSTIANKAEILLYEPKFRKVVIDKMNEIEETIDMRVKDFKNAEYNKAIKLFKDSIMGHLRNTKMRGEMFKHLNRLHHTILKYSVWANGHKMKAIFKELRAILYNIKTHPLYVADWE